MCVLIFSCLVPENEQVNKGIPADNVLDITVTPHHLHILPTHTSNTDINSSANSGAHTGNSLCALFTSTKLIIIIKTRQGVITHSSHPRWRLRHNPIHGIYIVDWLHGYTSNTSVFSCGRCPNDLWSLWSIPGVHVVSACGECHSDRWRGTGRSLTVYLPVGLKIIADGVTVERFSFINQPLVERKHSNWRSGWKRLSKSFLSFFFISFLTGTFFLSLNIGAVLHWYSWVVSSCAATQDAPESFSLRVLLRDSVKEIYFKPCLATQASCRERHSGGSPDVRRKGHMIICRSLMQGGRQSWRELHWNQRLRPTQCEERTSFLGAKLAPDITYLVVDYRT